jgi:ComF family protein
MRRSVPLAVAAIALEALPHADLDCLACSEPTAVEICRRCVLEADLGSGFREADQAHRYRLGRYSRVTGPRRGEPTSLARALGMFKYGGDRRTGHRLAQLFGRFAPSLPTRHDLVVPVPLHPRRLRRRGFNQAAWLASAASRTLRVPLCAGALHRIREGHAQATLGAADRREAMNDVFTAHASMVDGASVLLVDDVLTTGSTAAAAAHCLAATGARRVDLAVLLVANRY